MNMLFFFFYIVNGLIVPSTYGASIDFKTKKPIICLYWGDRAGTTRQETPLINASALPAQCEVILLGGFVMSPSSEPTYYEHLDEVLQLNRPVLLEVDRSEGYRDWSTILTPEGNEKDAKALTDFATSKGVAGVIITSVAPVMGDDVADISITKNIIPYLCQLKINDDFIVGVNLEPFGEQLLDPCVIDFDAMNPLVDFYVVNTLRTYPFCEIENFNGLSPIKSTNGIDGIDTVIEEISQTNIAVDKIYMVASLLVVNPDNELEYLSYSEVCVTKNDTSKWCAPTTKDYYEKGKFFQSQNYGVLVEWPEFDDVNNACGCCPFIAVINTAAGYKGEQQIPCTKFDIKDYGP